MKIAVLGFLGMGDMIIFSPFFRLLKENIKDSEIHLITSWKVVAELFKDSPYISSIIYYDFLNSSLVDRLKFVKKLRDMGFDMSILPYPSFRREFHIMSWLVNAKERYAFKFDKGLFKELIFLNNNLVEADLSKHNVENNLNLLQRIGVNIQSYDKIVYELPIEISDEVIDKLCNILNFDKHEDIIGIHPGSDSRGKERRWAIDNYARLCDYLYESLGVKSVVFFGPHEVDLKDKFIRFCKYKHIIVNNFNIKDVARLISICKLFVSGDSGLMHLACAMNTPVVAIFGPTNPKFVGPWGVDHEIVSLKLDCSPCFIFTEKHPLNKPLIECKITDKFACINMLDIKPVIEAIERLSSRCYTRGIR